jgi:hypothetical protein
MGARFLKAGACFSCTIVPLKRVNTYIHQCITVYEQALFKVRQLHWRKPATDPSAFTAQ